MRDLLSNSFIVRPVNDLKSAGFLTNLSYESKKERTVIEELVIINLFADNYARPIDYQV